MRNALLFSFNLVTFVRFLLTLFAFLKRRIPPEETISVPLAFGLYLLGFPLLARGASEPVGWGEISGVGLFLLGSFLNTFGELQRHLFKRRPENKGKLYDQGLFSLSIHINYFGDLLWVTGYALVTHNPYAFAVPVFLFCFFQFFNIPKLDAHLREHYGERFVAYERKTKRFVPFLL
jgi:steroid 5-alpha reductase family enzyme